MWFSCIIVVIVIQHHLFAVQLITCLWDTPYYSNLHFQQQVNPIWIQWVVEYQAVMWLMESLHRAIFIPFGWILGTSENFELHDNSSLITYSINSTYYCWSMYFNLFGFLFYEYYYINSMKFLMVWLINYELHVHAMMSLCESFFRENRHVWSTYPFWC